MSCSFDLVEIIKTYISIKNERESEYKHLNLMFYESQTFVHKVNCRKNIRLKNVVRPNF